MALAPVTQKAPATKPGLSVFFIPITATLPAPSQLVSARSLRHQLRSAERTILPFVGTPPLSGFGAKRKFPDSEPKISCRPQ